MPLGELAAGQGVAARRVGALKSGGLSAIQRKNRAMSGRARSASSSAKVDARSWLETQAWMMRWQIG